MRIYNSEFEISARLLVLMSVWKKPEHADTIIAADFISIYAHSFSVAETNLNGYNDFLYSEFSNLRAIGIKALKGLSLLGFVEPHYSAKGIEYLISEKGLEYTSKLDSSYYRKYSNTAQKVKNFFEKRDLKNPVQFIYINASRNNSGRRVE
jgi:hypothetical protein